MWRGEYKFNSQHMQIKTVTVNQSKLQLEVWVCRRVKSHLLLSKYCFNSKYTHRQVARMCTFFIPLYEGSNERQLELTWGGKYPWKHLAGAVFKWPNDHHVHQGLYFKPKKCRHLSTGLCKSCNIWTYSLHCLLNAKRMNLDKYSWVHTEWHITLCYRWSYKLYLLYMAFPI